MLFQDSNFAVLVSGTCEVQLTGERSLRQFCVHMAGDLFDYLPEFQGCDSFEVLVHRHLPRPTSIGSVTGVHFPSPATLLQQRVEREYLFCKQFGCDIRIIYQLVVPPRPFKIAQT
jgi:hypothetical protein